MYTGFLWGNLREIDHLEDPGLDGRTILRLIFRNWDVRGGQHRSGSGQGKVAGTRECGNELSGSMKCGEFLG